MPSPPPPPSAVLRVHRAPIHCVRFLAPPLPPLLASGDATGVVHLWDLDLESPILTISPPAKSAPSPVLSIVQDPLSPTTLHLHSKSGTIRSVSLARNPFSLDSSLALVSGSSKEVSILPDSFCAARSAGPGLLAAAFGEDVADVALVDMRTDASRKPVVVASPASRRGFLMCIDVLAENSARDVVAGYEDGSMCVWDLRVTGSTGNVNVKGRPVEETEGVGEGTPVLGVGGRYGAGSLMAVGAAAKGGVSAVWGGKIVAKGGVSEGVGMAALKWRDDGRIVVGGGWDGVVRVWDGRRKGGFLRRLGRLEAHDGEVMCVDLQTAGGLVATGGKDTTVAVHEQIY